jgi:hypothetical protein
MDLQSEGIVYSLELQPNIKTLQLFVQLPFPQSVPPMLSLSLTRIDVQLPLNQIVLSFPLETCNLATEQPTTSFDGIRFEARIKVESIDAFAPTRLPKPTQVNALYCRKCSELLSKVDSQFFFFRFLFKFFFSLFFFLVSEQFDFRKTLGVDFYPCLQNIGWNCEKSGFARASTTTKENTLINISFGKKSKHKKQKCCLEKHSFSFTPKTSLIMFSKSKTA